MTIVRAIVAFLLVILALATAFILGLELQPANHRSKLGSALSELNRFTQRLDAITAAHVPPGSPLLKDDLAALESHIGGIISLIEREASSAQWIEPIDVAALLSAVAWPLVLGLFLGILLLVPSVFARLGQLLRPFRSVKLFGTEFVLTEGLGQDARQTLQYYRDQLKREYDVRVAQFGLEAQFQQVLRCADLDRLSKSAAFRCTLHVPDALFRNSLYQLLDYFPRGGGSGRAWSERYGIIGRAWRLAKPQLKGGVPTDAEVLIGDWGMTWKEAKGGRCRSFFCGILRNKENDPVGIFYMDSVAENAFGAESTVNELQRVIAKECEERGVTQSLSKISSEVQSRGPRIDIYE